MLALNPIKITLVLSALIMHANDLVVFLLSLDCQAAALGPADGGKKGRKCLDPTGLLESIRRVAPQFRGRAQQDSHELVCALLSECDEELRRARKASNRAAKSEAAGKKDSSNDDVNGRNSSSDEEADQDGAKTDVETPSLIDQTFGANLWNVVRTVYGLPSEHRHLLDYVFHLFNHFLCSPSSDLLRALRV